MKESSVSVVILVALTTLVSGSRAQTSSLVSGENSPLTIVIYDYAQVPVKQLEAAKSEVSRVFRHAGVKTRWVDCSNRPAFPSPEPCSHPPEEVGFVMEIVPRELSLSVRYPTDAFGVAVILPEDIGVSAGYVFYDRVKAKCEDPDFLAVLLGEIMVHELGHLILGPGSHSLTGIMSAAWRNEELLDASRGTLLFTQAQSEQIKLTLALRNRREVAVFSHLRAEW